MISASISLFCELLVFYSSYFIRKDKNVWVFGAMRGQQYTGNAKYLFEYVNQHTDIQAIWISKNSALVSELCEKGFQAYRESSYKALHYASRAKIAVITHRGNRKESDLPFQAFTRKTKIIQLWHGIPLKKIAYDDTLFSFKHDEGSLKWKLKCLLKNTFFPFLDYVNSPSLILALSDETRDIFYKAFRVQSRDVQITGYPRNDMLHNVAQVEESRAIKKVIYMPTFRGSESSKFDLFLQYGFDVRKLDRFLHDEKMTLDIKLHPFNSPSGELLLQLEKAANISLLDYDDIYEILGDYDLLITDYSSVYFDYLLLDRPVIFAPFDQGDYMKKDREFYFDYDEVTPGPKVTNWGEVMEQMLVLNRSIGASDVFAKERDAIKNRFHRHQDNESTKRVYEAIAKIADEN